MSVYKRKRSPYYICDFRLSDGTRIRESARTSVLKDARAFERNLYAKLEAKLKDATPAAPAEGLTAKKLHDWDLARAAAKKVGLDRINQEWKPILRFFGDSYPVKDITEERILEFISFRREGMVVNNRRYPPAKGQTIKRELQALKRTLSRAQRQRYIDVVPYFEKPRSEVKDEKKRRRARTIEEVKQFLSLVDEECRRFYLLIALTGLRPGEVRRIKPDWIEPAPKDARCAHLLHVKDQKHKSATRVVPLIAEGLELINRQTEADQGCNELFHGRDFAKAYVRASKQMGLPNNMKPSDMRACHATWALAEDASIVTVRDLLGHTNIATTQHYVQSVSRREGDEASHKLASKLLGGTLGAHSGAHSDSQANLTEARLMEVFKNLKESMVGRQRFELWTNGLKGDVLGVLDHLSSCNYCARILTHHHKSAGLGHTSQLETRQLKAGNER